VGDGRETGGAAHGEQAFLAARAMLGVRFRPQGRDAVRGLDCVGLIWAAYAAAKVPLRAPVDYPLRGWRGLRIGAALAQSGLVRACDMGQRGRRIGDVLLCSLGAGQFHLGLGGAESVIHAHAGLGRVAESPWDADWAEADVWRVLDGAAAG
jgi:cell wall-associated NlpC family hydrolase